MEEKINIAELLKDCPKGMELDCTMFNKVTLFTVDDREGVVFPIIVFREDGNPIVLTKYGQYTDADFAKCVIFPKGKTTWEGFHRPFEDGDIIYTKHKLGTEFISIFQIEYERDICTYWDINLSTNKLIGNLHEGNAFKVFIEKDKVKEQRFATEEEKERLFRAIKDNGYQWNSETKTLEKLIKPIFKAGDKVRRKNNHNLVFTITSIEEDSYGCGANLALWFDDQDQYELVPNKFNINTLVPFESRVLVRYNKEAKWCPAIWGFYDYEKGLPHRYAIVGGITFAYCIPYEGNEHLLGKTEDCKDFYKTWE